MTYGLDIRFYATAAAWLEQARTNALEQLAIGFANDFSQYRERVGYVRALDDVLNELQAIEKRITQG